MERKRAGSRTKKSSVFSLRRGGEGSRTLSKHLVRNDEELQSRIQKVEQIQARMFLRLSDLGGGGF